MGHAHNYVNEGGVDEATHTKMGSAVATDSSPEDCETEEEREGIHMREWERDGGENSVLSAVSKRRQKSL